MTIERGNIIFGEVPECPHVDEMGGVCVWEDAGGCYARTETKKNCDKILGVEEE